MSYFNNFTKQWSFQEATFCRIFVDLTFSPQMLTEMDNSTIHV